MLTSTTLHLYQDADRRPFKMLIAALIIWLLLVVAVVALCRIAASADGRNPAPVPVPAPVLADLRTTGRDAPGRVGRYAAES